MNFGFWGTVTLPPGAGDGYYNSSVEDKVTELAGTRACTPPRTTPQRRFWGLYNGPAYPALKAEYDPGGPTCRLYEKCVAAGSEPGGKEMGMALAEVFEQVAGPDAGVRVRAYDGSSTGAADSPVTITVRSPVAVSYLAQAPGSMGLARAYVSGHLDVDGDMYTALARMVPAQRTDLRPGRAAGPAAPAGRAEGCCSGSRRRRRRSGSAGAG